MNKEARVDVSDPTCGIEAQCPKDFNIFINLVDFFRSVCRLHFGERPLRSYGTLACALVLTWNTPFAFQGYLHQEALGALCQVGLCGGQADGWIFCTVSLLFGCVPDVLYLAIRCVAFIRPALSAFVSVGCMFAWRHRHCKSFVAMSTWEDSDVAVFT